MIPLGALAILAAWRYTGGDNPYGYRGLGEVYVFVFFGLVATLGTLYTQAHGSTWTGLAGAVGVGAIASAILVANNLRDIPTDRETGKRTLAVRLGDRGTRVLYVALLVVALVMAALASRVDARRGRCSRSPHTAVASRCGSCAAARRGRDLVPCSPRPASSSSRMPCCSAVGDRHRASA